MRRLLVCLILLIPVLPLEETHANKFLATEAGLVLIAAASAEEPELAAAVDALVLLTIPASPEFKTETQQTIAYIGMGALALYNYEAEDEGYSKDEIFSTNLVVLNIVIAAELFGLNDGKNNFSDIEGSGASFNFQLSPEGESRFVWQYRF